MLEVGISTTSGDKLPDSGGDAAYGSGDAAKEPDKGGTSAGNRRVSDIATKRETRYRVQS